MSYGLVYTVPFATLKGYQCVVEIEKEGYEGEPMELTAGGTPFTVDIEDEEFLYIPTRFSSAKLHIHNYDSFLSVSRFPSETYGELEHQKMEDVLMRFEKVLGKNCILFRNLET